MSRFLEIVRVREQPVIMQPAFWRVIYDDESVEWGWKSRTKSVTRPDGTYFAQLPSVYGYSPEMAWKPNDYHVDESKWQDAYYELNDFNVDRIRDGEGYSRCESYLFRGDVALYNNPSSPERGFPRRELLTMSGNQLQEIGWAVDLQNRKYLKFKTLRPGDIVHEMTHETHPHFVHRFMIVMYRDGVTITMPKVSRNGFLFYYLVSKEGFGYMPERYVRKP